MHYLSLRVSGYNSKRPTCKISSGLKPSHGFHWKGLWEVNFGSWIWSMQSFAAEWRNCSPYEWDQRSKSSKKSEPKKTQNQTSTWKKRYIWWFFLVDIWCLFSPSITSRKPHSPGLLQPGLQRVHRHLCTFRCPCGADVAWAPPTWELRAEARAPPHSYHCHSTIEVLWDLHSLEPVTQKWKKTKWFVWGEGSCMELLRDAKMMYTLHIYENYVYCSMIYWLYNYI